MNFTSENFSTYPIITNPDLTLEEVIDVYHEFIAFLTYKNNTLDLQCDMSVWYKPDYKLYDVIYARQFVYEDLLKMYSTRDISLLIYGPEYNNLIYSAQSIFISNITNFQPFDMVKERRVIENILEIQDINVDKFMTYYKLYENYDNVGSLK
jgi:hypothetical protein